MCISINKGTHEGKGKCVIQMRVPRAATRDGTISMPACMRVEGDKERG